jgi:hypothetical protein
MTALTDKFLTRLDTSVHKSYDDLKHHREARKECIKQMAGHRYSRDKGEKEVIVNLMHQMVVTYQRLLASANPKVIVTTMHPELYPYSETLRLGVNHLIGKLDLKKTISAVVQDAIFGIGISKTGLQRCKDNAIAVDGQKFDVGMPFCRQVSLEDFVWDTAAKCWDDVDYLGNRYYRPRDYVAKRFKQQDIIPDEPKGSDMRPEDNVSGADDTNENRLRDYVLLWDVWLPKENQVITVQDGRWTEPLRTIEWDGPDTGPYDMLSFINAPDELMPVSPANNLYELHMFANLMFRKMGRQASRQKSILAYENGAEQDAQKIVGAGDGETINVENLEKLKEVNFGGANPMGVNTLIYADQMFNKLAGNLESLAGLGAQAETARQDQLIHRSASGLIEVMAGQVHTFVKTVIRKLAWYLWTDPLIEIPLIKRIPGVDIDIPVAFTPDEREGDFLDYNFDIVPYSMREKTPDEQANTLYEFLERWVVPTMPYAMESGLMVNIQEISKRLAELSDLNFEQIYQQMDPAMQQQGHGPVGDMPRPASTTRRYIRESRPGTTPQGTANALLMANAGIQGNQAQAM